MELTTIIGLVTGTASVIGAYVSYTFAKRAADRQKQFQEVELANWTHQYHAEIRTWADQVVEAISTAVLICDLDPAKCATRSLFERRHAALARLSALIDSGRWFFPNENLMGDRQDRRIVFRGYRDPILDPVVNAYGQLQTLDYKDQTRNRDLRARLAAVKREFTDKMQIVLDPNVRNADFERFVSMTAELREEQNTEE